MTRDGVTPRQLDGLGEATPPEEIKQRQGPGGRMLDYIDARFVMDRLDGIIGPENWQTQFVDRADGSVRCGLSILIEGEWVTKWDVGDPSDIEANKGAHSEALKRAAVHWGIARDLYGHSPKTGAARPVTTPRPAAPPPPAGDVPQEPDYLRDADRVFGDVRVQQQDEAATRDGFCPDHGLAWSLRPGGVSKTTGKPYDAFWSCPNRELPYCKQKPSVRWAAMHEGGAA